MLPFNTPGTTTDKTVTGRNGFARPQRAQNIMSRGMTEDVRDTSSAERPRRNRQRALSAYRPGIKLSPFMALWFRRRMKGTSVTVLSPPTVLLFRKIVRHNTSRPGFDATSISSHSASLGTSCKRIWLRLSHPKMKKWLLGRDGMSDSPQSAPASTNQQ